MSIEEARKVVRARKWLSYDPTQDCKLVGAVRVFGGIKDSIMIVHARPGCHSGVLLLRTFTSNQDDVRVVSSGLRSHDMIYGGERRLAIAIKLACKHFKPALIAVLSCSAPAIMGDDVEGVAELAKREVPAEVLPLSTGGYEGPAWFGYEEALEKLTQYMIPSERDRGVVNLVGFKQDDIRSSADLLEIKRILKGMGIRVNTVLTSCTFEELKRAPRATLNVVLGGDGLRCAKVMEERFGVPYVVVPYPYGLSNTVEFVERIAEALNENVDQDFIEKEKERVRRAVKRVHLYIRGLYDTSVAVIGDAGRAFDLAKFLSNELGFNVKVLAITSRNYLVEEKAEECRDYYEELLVEPDRLEMEAVVKSKEVEMIFGSTMEKKLAHKLGAPLVRVFYPVIDEVAISDAPYAGFRGTIHLIEKILNSVINNYLEREEVDVLHVSNGVGGFHE
jgi:nitrogenase molybdenum-iron protein beta chain